MKRLTLAVVAAAVSLLAGNAMAQLKHVAVVETEVGPSAKITKEEAMEITAALRREAINNLTRGKYNIMTNETIQSMGGAVLEKCAEENCVISFGEMIGADYVVRGAVRKVGAKLSVTVEIHEIDHGMLVALSDPVMSDNIEDLIEKTTAACAKLFKKFESEQAVAQKGPVAATPTTPTYQPPVPVPPPPVYQPPVPTPTSTPKPTPTPTPPPTPTPTYQQSKIDGPILTDSRDGKTYKTVVIGGKTWMAENLNHKKGQSWCYKNDNSNCDKYGRLYDWKTAKTVCPSGYHLPYPKEWDDLVKAVGGSKAGEKLKATSGWSNNGNGTDDYGWSALPGGGRKTGGSFDGVGNYGYWWMVKTEMMSAEWCELCRDLNAYFRRMGYGLDGVSEGHHALGFGFSVRCVAD